MSWYTLKVKWLIGPILILFALPGVAHAATPYFEFNPDYSESILVNSSGGTVDQVFLPLNEFLAGLDIWISTGGTTGTATFSLLNTGGTELAQTTASLPAIADSADGIRFHVALPSQLSVNGGQAYTLRISSGLVGLRLYEAGSNPLLAHNAQPQLQYFNGMARINGVDMNFSFKYALYENHENLPPVLTNLTATQPDIGSAVISWNANEPVDAQVTYNTLSVPFTGQYSSCLPSVGMCSVSLTVQPGASYSYTLTASDVWGNLSTLTGSFDALGAGQTPAPTPTPTPTASVSPTATPPDTTKPVISNLRAVSITGDGFTMAWTTNEAANSTVAALQLPYLTFGAGNADATLELEHAVPLTGLIQDTSYRVKITTDDGFGNGASASIDVMTIRPTPLPTSPTPPPGTTPTPLASSPTPVPTISVGPASPTGTELQWTAPSGGTPSGGYRVDIIGTDGNLIRTIRTAVSHVNAGTIPAGARIVVYGDNAGVFQKVATPASVALPPSQTAGLPAWTLYTAGALVVAAGVGYLILKSRKRKPPLPTVPTGPTLPTSGAMPNPSQF